MAANLKSTLLTNRDATPKLLTDGFIAAGNLSQCYGYVFTGASDAAGSAYRMVTVPSGARLSSLSMINDTLGNSSKVDVAAWYPTVVPVGGGAFLSASSNAALISSSSFKTGVLGDTTNTTPSELIVTTNTNQNANYQEMPLWQMLGLASDPECMIDLGLTVRVAVAAAGYVGMKATYLY
jgi:hypothetical protein